MATLDALRQKQSKLMDQITGAKSDKIKRFYKRKLLLLNKEIGEVQAKGQIRQIWGQSAEEAKAKLKMAEKKRALEKSTKELKAAAKKAKESIPTTPSTSTKTVRTVVRGAKPGISGKVKAGIALGTIGVGALGLRALRHKKKVKESFDQYRLKLYEADVIDFNKHKGSIDEKHARRLITKINGEIAHIKSSNMRTEKEVAAIGTKLRAAKAELNRAQGIMNKLPSSSPVKKFPISALGATIIALLAAARVAQVTIRKTKQRGGDVRKKIKESIMENEDFLGRLYSDMRTSAKEWQGPNIPYGDDSNRPNLIRKCTMMEDTTQKINCLRKLRDQAAMNPFYQYRIDRYIDEITDTYEPTNKPGTIPGNEFKTSGVGEDTKIQPVQESKNISEGLRCAGAKYGYKGNLRILQIARAELANCHKAPNPEKCRLLNHGRIRVTRKPFERSRQAVKKHCGELPND